MPTVEKELLLDPLLDPLRAERPIQSLGGVRQSSGVQFTVNGQLFTVPTVEAAGKTLNDFIRFSTGFTGTKVSCGQGGCGACTVAIARRGEGLKSTASCLLPVASAHGAAILTAEGITSNDGCGELSPHPVQERLAKFNGSQCGFCTPGMVMQLFSTLSQRDGGKALSQKELEHCINGNICRCTGYRPIMECAKSFAKDTTVKNSFDDKCQTGPYDTKRDPDIVFPPESMLQDGPWLRPRSVADAMAAVARGAVPMAGGTAYGVYPELGVVGATTAFVDLRSIEDKGFAEVQIDSAQVQIGAGVTWTSFVDQLVALVGGVPNPQPFHELIARCGSIAGAQVRNNATLGGNVAITRKKGFLSDWVPLLCSLQAKVTVVTIEGEEQHDLLDFVRKDSLFDGLITSVSFPLPGLGVLFKAYRVAKRSRNAHALVNAGFLAVVAGDAVREASIVLGAVDPKPVRLQNLEQALVGISAGAVQKDASFVLKTLTDKMAAGDLAKLTCGFGRDQTDHIISGFVVKFLTVLFPQAVPKSWVSAEYCLHDMNRSTSSTQTFPRPPNLGGELHNPMPKTTILEQAMGLAKFTDDMPRPCDMLIAALICVPEACAKVTGIDDAAARAMLGDSFHSIYTYDNLRKKTHSWADMVRNSAVMGAMADVPPKYKPEFTQENQLCADENFLLPFNVPSLFASQPVAILLAQSDAPKLVEMAAARVSASLTLTREGKVAIGGLEAGVEITDAPILFTKGKSWDSAKAAGSGRSVVKGKFTKKSQHPFYIENQSVLSIPDERGLTCFSSSQGADMPQKSIAAATGLPMSKISVKFRRVGGGFGGKVVRPSIYAALSAQVALHTRKPVRLVLPKDIDMSIVGGRQEIDASWDVTVNTTTGEITALEYEIWIAHGATVDTQKFNGQVIGSFLDMNYRIPHFKVAVRFIKQSLAQRSAVRAPGHFEAIALIEAVMDGIAAELGLPFHKVREANFYKAGGASVNLAGGMMPPGVLDHYTNLILWDMLKRKINYEARYRQIQEFNQANAWKKRGISMNSARYGIFVVTGQTSRIDIFKDGSIQIALAGAEIGQGLHTKVGQIVTTHFHQLLGCSPPMGVLRFLDTSSEQNPNGNGTGGSSTSEGAMYSSVVCVDELAARIEPFLKQGIQKSKSEQKNPQGPWFDVIDAAFSKNFMGFLAIPPHFSATGQHMVKMPTEMAYETFGVATSEVELDVLTGESRVLSTHIMFDVGSSHNPMIDMGQVEGAFIMGMGHLLQEGMDFDKTTGRCLTNNTWDYKPPIACDIPEVFNADFVDLRSQASGAGVVNSVMMRCIGGIMGCCSYPWKATPLPQKYQSAKATGEPPMLLSLAVHSAHTAALVAARGAPLPNNMLPIPAKPFVTLPLIAGAKPGLAQDSATKPRDAFEVER